VLLAALLAHAQYLPHTQHHVLHIGDVVLRVEVGGSPGVSAVGGGRRTGAVVMMPQDEILDESLLTK